MFGWRSSQVLKLVVKSASAVPGVVAARTLTMWQRKVIDTEIIETSHPNFLCVSPIFTSSFWNRLDPAIFVEIAWFHRSKRCFVAYDKGFLEISLDDHFCEFGFYRVSHVILHS